MKRNVFGPVKDIVAKVQVGFDDEKLPVFAWCDYTFVYEATNHMKPWKPTSDLFALLAALKIHRPGDLGVPYNAQSPSLFCDHITDADRQTGEAAERWVNFWEVHILPTQIQIGASNRAKLIRFIDTGLLQHLSELPESYKHPCFSDFKNRLLGTLWVIGLVPFTRQCAASHVAALTKPGQCHALHEAIKATKTSYSMDTAFMNYAGEKNAWPEIEHTIGQLSNGDHSIESLAIDTVIQKHAIWKKQCRLTAIPTFVVPSVLRWVSKTLDARAISDGSGNQSFDASDDVVVWVYRRLMSLKALKWDDVKLHELLMKLSAVAASLRQHDDQANVVAAFDGNIASELVSEAKLVCFASALLSAIPPKPSAVLITGAHRQLVVNTLCGFAEQCLVRWPKAELYACAVAVQDRLQIDLDTALEAEGFNLSERVVYFKDRLCVFRRMQGFVNHVAEIAKVGAMTEDAVEQESTVTMLQKLQLYLDYFLADVNFKSISLAAEVVKTLDVNRDMAASSIQSFKLLYFANSLKCAQDLTDQVAAVAGGAPDGKAWSDTCPESASWSEFLGATELTLRQVRKVDLILAVKNCNAVTRLKQQMGYS